MSPVAAVSGTVSVGALRREIARTLAKTSSSAALDARLIVAHALKIDPGEVILRETALIGPETRRDALAMAARRAAGEPVARIVGEKEFWGLAFRLSAETLVPRPDTETLVSAALAAVRGRLIGTPQRILDIGTGSGAILLALLTELPDATGTGTDRARGALETARDNAGRLRLTGRAAFVEADWASGVAGPFDLVVSNPPYVEAGEIAALPLEVRDHDPHLALDGGQDGLDAYRAIIPDLDRLLAEHGRAFLEVGAGQAGAVAGLGATAGYVSKRHRDLAGIERVVELARRADG